MEFDKIEADVPASELTDLSIDQKYLAEMCKAIAIGHCSLDLSRRDPARLAHSRLLTAVNRILRLYVGTEKPSANLRILAEYIVKVYAQMWFRIKASPSCKDGAKHLW